jgi:hypothetical protein
VSVDSVLDKENEKVNRELRQPTLKRGKHEHGSTGKCIESGIQTGSESRIVVKASRLSLELQLKGMKNY